MRHGFGGGERAAPAVEQRGPWAVAAALAAALVAVQHVSQGKAARMGLDLCCSIASMLLFKQSELMVMSCCWCQWQLLLPLLLGALALRQVAMQR